MNEFQSMVLFKLYQTGATDFPGLGVIAAVTLHPPTGIDKAQIEVTVKTVERPASKYCIRSFIG